MTKVFFAADHAGYALKEALKHYVSTLGHEVEDFGATALSPEDDYPDFVTPLARAVALDSAARGIIVGGDGEGEAMAANRVSGVRAAVFYGPVRAFAPIDIEGTKAMDGFDIVRLTRKHNDANVLSLGARFTSGEDAREAVRIFLTNDFSGAARHARRIAKF